MNEYHMLCIFYIYHESIMYHISSIYPIPYMQAKDIFEMFARNAMFSTAPDGQGQALAYYSASGGPSTNECLPSTDPIPWSSEEWTPDKSPEIVKAANAIRLQPRNRREHRRVVIIRG